MTLTQLAVKDAAAFVALVKKLRAAGVVKLGALVLGPEPREHVADKPAPDPNAVARKRHEVMFAASRIRPPFVAPVTDAAMPRAIVQRRARDEAAGGAQKSQQ